MIFTLKIKYIQWILYPIETFCSNVSVNLSGLAAFVPHQALYVTQTQAHPDLCYAIRSRWC